MWGEKKSSQSWLKESSKKWTADSRIQKKKNVWLTSLRFPTSAALARTTFNSFGAIPSGQMTSSQNFEISEKQRKEHLASIFLQRLPEKKKKKSSLGSRQLRSGKMCREYFNTILQHYIDLPPPPPDPLRVLSLCVRLSSSLEYGINR